MHTGCKRPSFLAGAALLAAMTSLPAHAAPSTPSTPSPPSAQTVRRQVEPAIKGLTIRNAGYVRVLNLHGRIRNGHLRVFILNDYLRRVGLAKHALSRQDNGGKY